MVEVNRSLLEYLHMLSPALQQMEVIDWEGDKLQSSIRPRSQSEEVCFAWMVFFAGENWEGDSLAICLESSPNVCLFLVVPSHPLSFLDFSV